MDNREDMMEKLRREHGELEKRLDILAGRVERMKGPMREYWRRRVTHLQRRQFDLRQRMSRLEREPFGRSWLEADRIWAELRRLRDMLSAALN